MTACQCLSLVTYIVAQERISLTLAQTWPEGREFSKSPLYLHCFLSLWFEMAATIVWSHKIWKPGALRSRPGNLLCEDQSSILILDLFLFVIVMFTSSGYCKDSE